MTRSGDGRFTKGCRAGPGRPKGLDFRAVVEREAARRDVSLPEALWSIFQGQLAKAVTGDTAAARFCIERLCLPEDASNERIDFAALISESRPRALTNEGD